MTIDYPVIADQWQESGCFQTPSALHGWLTGYLATGQRLTPIAWITEATAYLELQESPAGPLLSILTEFYPAVLGQLSDEDMSFECLLPDDEEADLIDQVDCLAQWSKGFLDGFGAAGAITGKLPDDVAEVLRHLDAFSQANVEEDDEDNRMLYQQLTEHARVAAMTVFYGMNQSVTEANNKPTLQ